MSYPITNPDTPLARALGIRTCKVTLRGGAAKLLAMDPDARAVLLGNHYPGGSLLHHRGGMKARGMARKPVPKLIDWRKEREIERKIQDILRERGLLK